MPQPRGSRLALLRGDCTFGGSGFTMHRAVPSSSIMDKLSEHINPTIHCSDSRQRGLGRDGWAMHAADCLRAAGVGILIASGSVEASLVHACSSCSSKTLPVVVIPHCPLELLGSLSALSGSVVLDDISDIDGSSRSSLSLAFGRPVDAAFVQMGWTDDNEARFSVANAPGPGLGQADPFVVITRQTVPAGCADAALVPVVTVTICGPTRSVTQEIEYAFWGIIRRVASALNSPISFSSGESLQKAQSFCENGRVLPGAGVVEVACATLLRMEAEVRLCQLASLAAGTEADVVGGNRDDDEIEALVCRISASKALADALEAVIFQVLANSGLSKPEDHTAAVGRAREALQTNLHASAGAFGAEAPQCGGGYVSDELHTSARVAAVAGAARLLGHTEAPLSSIWKNSDAILAAGRDEVEHTSPPFVLDTYGAKVDIIRRAIATADRLLATDSVMWQG